MSIAEPRYCAIGNFCQHALAARWVGPKSLSKSENGLLCRRCKEANYRVDDLDVLKHHRKLVHAAGALLDEGAIDEHRIIPTLVFATLSDRDEVYAEIGERLLADHPGKATSDAHVWAELYRKFSGCFHPIKPHSWLGDDVPVLWCPPIWSGYTKDSAKSQVWVRAIQIEIHKPVERSELRRFYERALKVKGLSHYSGYGRISWERTDSVLRMLVQPGQEPELNPIAANSFALNADGTYRWEPPPFADPGDVASIYGALKDRGYVNEPGSSKKREQYITVAAAVAWYLAARDVAQGHEAEKISRLVKACLVHPRRDRLPELSKRWQLWRDLQPRLPKIRQTEDELRAHTDLNNPYGLVHKTF